MKARIQTLVSVFSFLVLATLLASAQEAKPGLLTAAELKKAVPANYFFRGQSATVQERNAGGLRVAGGKLVLFALVDTSGYAQDVAEKYQGLLITETKINIGGTEVGPGQYGFGFNADGKFRVMDVAANELLKADIQNDDNLKRPVPLTLKQEGGEYRLYKGKKYVVVKAG